MICTVKDLTGLMVTVSEEKAGKISDFYFNDVYWNVRFAEIKQKWLALTNILITNHDLGEPDLEKSILPLMITKKELKKEPDSDSVKTVSEHKEGYQSALMAWPLNLSNLTRLNVHEAQELANIMVRDKISEKEMDEHLRSINEVIDYRVVANDDDFGSMEDMIIDTEIWKIKYLVAKESHFLKSNKRFLIPPALVGKISWESNSVEVNADKKILLESPEYDNSKPISQKFDNELFDYFKKTKQGEKQ